MKKAEKYSLKIPKAFYDIYSKYIKEHSELGFNTVSQYIIDLLRRDIRAISDKSRS
ncbi:hypothetical protein LCGC14_1549620 [marine sediment metagenome]|uniref:CopG family transcriptional regulator n=1 Tax=marine sediment metagenome TaxID=412755 RepID=A0A0F9L6N6_9ZZZZ